MVWFLGPLEAITQTVFRSVRPFFVGLTIVRNRQTDGRDRPRYSVCNNRPHLRTYSRAYCDVA